MAVSATLRVLSSPHFRLYMIANFFSSVGVWVQRLATGWLAWQLSHSELWVGLIAFASLAPVMVLSLPIGVLMDRSNVRLAALVVNSGYCVIAFALWMLNAGGWMTKEVLLGMSIVMGIANSAYTPVRLALIPSLAPRPMLADAVAMHSLVFNVTRLIGPALGAALIAAYSAGAAFLYTGVSFIPLLFALWQVREDREKPVAQGPANFGAQFAEGMRYAWESRLIRWQLLMTASVGAFGRGTLDLLPVYSHDLIGGTPTALATLTFAAAAGALMASVFCASARLEREAIRTTTILLAVLAAAALALLPLKGVFAATVFLIGAIGFAATSTGTLSQTLVQLEVADDVRARVTSLWGLLTLGGAAVGGLVQGWLLEIMGMAQATWLVAAVALIVPVVSWLDGQRHPDRDTQN